MKRVFAAVVALFTFTALLLAQNPAHTNQPKALPTIAEKTAAMQSFPGFFTDYWDAREGTLWLRIENATLETPFILYESLPSGMGSNDIGLDRGEPGESYVVHFERSGKQIFLVAENENYRAVTDDAEQQRAVRGAFPQSVLWGFEVAAEDSDAVLIDATKFFLSDVHGVAAAIANAKQGKYKVEPTRSAIYLPRTRNFPENTDIESTLTFVGEEPGNFVKHVTLEPHAITVREHISLIQAPPAGFHARAYDPRSGYFICQQDAGGCPTSLLYGGTSVSAPVWAAIVAVLNQQENRQLGFLNPILYPLANTKAFHSSSELASDFAHVGLGSPNVDRLHLRLSNSSPGPFDVSKSFFGAFPPTVVGDGQSKGGLAVLLVDANGNSVHEAGPREWRAKIGNIPVRVA